MPSITLPTANGGLEAYPLRSGLAFPDPGRPPFDRIAYAAVHVVADPMAAGDPWLDASIDWEATIRYRAYLWDLGLGVAEAMDTAQRGMGLDWTGARNLIRRTLDAAGDRREALLASGVGTDHLIPGPHVEIDNVIAAYEEQIEFVESLGGRVVLMASRALAACASGPDDYVRVYDRILSQVNEPVIIHWLGGMFDPALEGYWGHADYGEAMSVCLSVIEAHADRVDGIKISLLDKDREIAMRRRLPAGVRMFTGDDFNFAELIAGDAEGHSDALLGIFDAIAPVASAALGRLSDGDIRGFTDLLAPTVPFSRHIFRAPTRFYKTGVVLMAYLNGHQDHFVMIGGQQSARSIVHMAEIFRLADRAGLLGDADLAVDRMRSILSIHGIR